MANVETLPLSISAKWKYAIIGGLPSIPFTAVSYWQSGSEVSIVPVLFGGLLAGYLAKRRLGYSRGIGARVGLIGGLPVIWMLSDFFPTMIGASSPTWFTVASIVMVIQATILGFMISALHGEVGGRIGGWLSGRGGRVHQTRTPS